MLYNTKEKKKANYIKKRDAGYYRNWRLKNHDKFLDYCRKYRKKNRIEMNKKALVRARKYREKNRESFNLKHKEYVRKVRERAIREYGSICICCGQSEYKFLTFDHINNDGYKEKRMGKRGINYALLRGEKKRKDIQLLCYNCNMSKAFWGQCPCNMLKGNKKNENLSQ